MRLRLDLRHRIALVLAAVCIAIVGGLGITLYMASEDLETGLVDQLISEELDFLVQRSQLSGTPVASSSANLRHYVLRRPEDYPSIPAELRNLSPGRHEIGEGADERHVGVREVGGVRYMVAYDAAAHEIREARFRQSLWIALATIVVISAAFGYWASGILTRQLTDLAARVSRLAPDDPQPPLESPGHDREVAALARALDRYHARIVEMIAREKEFTANASHELRTPLTSMRTSCELLAGEKGLTEKGRARLAMIASAADQMTERIETLLYLARGARAEAVETVSLRACVIEAALPYRDEISHKGLAFEVSIREDVMMKLNRQALQLVLTNLIRNAIRHTERGFVRVTYDAPRLTVGDSGSGIAAEHLPQVFERFYRGERDSDGLGLGLAIVRRICEDLHWKIDVVSRPGAGAAFSIVLA